MHVPSQESDDHVYMFVRGIHFASFYDFSIGFWICSDNDIGCFSNVLPYINALGKLPLSPDHIGTLFHLHTRQNPTKSISLHLQTLLPTEQLNNCMPILNMKTTSFSKALVIRLIQLSFSFPWKPWTMNTVLCWPLKRLESQLIFYSIFGGKTTKDLQQYIHHLTKENLCFNNDYIIQ
jgi:hypothetical protein